MIDIEYYTSEATTLLNSLIGIPSLSREEETAAYNVDITVFANDRAGLLAEVIQVLGNVKTKLIALNSKTTKEHIATIEITIEVENIEELNKVLKELRKIDSVYEVARKK